MKFLLISIGTRGDMEPFLAIAEILKSEGHEVCCVFPEQFAGLADDSKVQFASLGREFIELLDGPAGRLVMGGSGTFWQKLKAYKTLVQKQKPIQKDMLQHQKEICEEFQPDRIIHNGKAVYPVIWSLTNPGKTTFVSPVPYIHYVKGHAHVAFSGNWGIFNKFSYKLANFGLVKTIMSSVKWLKMGKGVSQRQIQSALLNNQAIYTISPSLFKRPSYWKKNIQVLGYHERNKKLNWEPSKELQEFMSKHKQVIMVTFGSMLNPNPAQKTKALLDVLGKLKLAAIINTAAGGLLEPTTYDREQFLFVNQIPYDWLFPKLQAVVHHGGSGTTHTALKYGLPSMIVPHIIDQFVWNELIAQKKLGPKGPKMKQLSSKNLEHSISDLVGNPIYANNAKLIAQAMAQEDFVEDLHRSLLA